MAQSAAPSPKATPFFSELTFRQVVVGTLVVMAVGLGFWLLFQLRTVIFSLFVAFVFSTALNPTVEWLRRRKVPRVAAMVGIYVLGLALVAGLLWALLPSLISQGALLADRLEVYYRTFVTAARESPIVIVRRLGFELPGQIDGAVTSGPAQGEPLDMFNQATIWVQLAGKQIFVIVTVFLLVFYWTLERERTLRWLFLLAPADRRDYAQGLYSATEATVGEYLRGLLWLCLAVGGVSLAAYWLIGLPAALVLGLIAGLMEAIPLVGPLLGALPAVIVALSTDPSKVMWVVAIAAGIQLLENVLLVPRIMRRAVGINPVVTLLAIGAFGALFGVTGAFLAVPLAAVIQLILYRTVFDAAAVAPAAPEGRNHLSALRVEVQELVQDVRKQVRHKPEALDGVNDEIEDSIEAAAQDLDSVLARALRSEVKAA